MLQDYYVLLYNATALWLTIGLIWVVMGCYGRKSKFADAPYPAPRPNTSPSPTLQRISFGFINFLPNSLLFFLSLYLPLSFVIIKARSDSLKIQHSTVAPNILTFISILFDKLFPKTTSPSPIVQPTT